MKKYFSLLLLSLVMVMCFSVSVFAEVTETDVSANQDGSVMAIFDSETGVMTIRGNGPMIDYASEEDNYSVKWSNVTKLVIEEGVTHIGNYAFSAYRSWNKTYYRLTALTEEIVIPSSVETIGKYAFMGATIPKITIGSGVTEIGDGAFKGANINSIEFADNSSLTTIGSSAFYGSNLAAIDIPASCTTISDSAFKGSKLTSINVPEGCTTISSLAFANCTSLETVVLPSTITSIGVNVFADSKYIKSFTWVSADVDIGENPFSINMGYSATDKVATVHANHIYMKESLEALGYTVSTVGETTGSPWDTYPDCYTFEVGAENSTDVMAYFNSYSGVFTLRGSGAMANYGGYKTGTGYSVPYSAYISSIKKLVIEEGVTRIGEYAFYTNSYTSSTYMDGLEEPFTFPSTLESIGYSAFDGTNYPGALVVPATLKTFESLPTKGVTSVYFEEGVENIGACPNCDTITSVYIPSTAKNIPGIGSANLSELTIMADGAGLFDVTPIGATLGKNVSAKTATVREDQYYLIECLEYLGFTVNTIAGEELEPWETYPTGVYSYTPYVTNVGADGDNVKCCYNSITKTMKFWGEGAIQDYEDATIGYVHNPLQSTIGSTRTVIFYDGITEIGDKLFDYCWSSYVYADASSITSVTIPSTVTRIGSWAFGYLGASEIVIPESVETIEAYAFKSASPTVIYNLSEENQTIGDDAFNVSSSSAPTVYQYRANTAMEAAVAPFASEIIYFDDDSVVLSGTLDNGVTWEYDPTTKTLTFGGSGEIPSYEDGSQPWYSAASTYGGVGNYVFGSGITGFGSGVIGSYGSSYGSDGSGSLFYYPSGSDGLLGSLNSYGSGGTYGGVTPSGGSGGTGGDSGTGGAGGSTDEGSDGDNTGGSTDTGDGSGSSGNSGSTGSDTSSDDTTMIIVDAEPTNFLVTVPIRIDVEMDADGNVTTGDGYYVENECAMGPILITDIKVVPATNWSLVDWNSDFYNMKASSKVIGLTINGVEVGSDGSVVMNDSLSSVIRNKEFKELFFGAKLSAQKSTLQANAAAVIFTVDFDKV